MSQMPHMLNWICGWCLVLAGFVSGTAIGIFFARDNWMGGYASWPRRLVRLGHVALVMLGLFNVVYGMASLPRGGAWQGAAASWAFIVGGIAMPTVCFLSAWRIRFKALFFIPVSAVVAAVLFILIGT